MVSACLWLAACGSRGEVLPGDPINGICFVAPRNPITVKEMAPVREANANWIAVVPYAFSHADDPKVNYDTARQWWGEGAEGIRQTIAHAKQLGLKVMLKPHVWIAGQGWAGDFTLDNEKDWQQWEQSYARYLRIMTTIADRMQVDMLCIGTEYRKAVVARPRFWRSLIDTIRQTYKGKLTYAANWDNYENVVFWDQLDYIGVDAYFPLCEDRTPDEATLVDAWQTPLKGLKKTQKKFGKPVLFTEYGYQSADYTSRGHWHFGQDKLTVNLQAQRNAYAALYEVFWDEPWFAGGFLWKWFAGDGSRIREEPTGYTPQNKPALEVIRQVYEH